jgi:ferredoxin
MTTTGRVEGADGLPEQAKIVLDPDLCAGHGRCYLLVPELFGEDEVGHSEVLGDGVVEGERLERARLAAANCPERAISLQDL